MPARPWHLPAQHGPPGRITARPPPAPGWPVLSAGPRLSAASAPPEHPAPWPGIRSRPARSLTFQASSPPVPAAFRRLVPRRTGPPRACARSASRELHLRALRPPCPSPGVPAGTAAASRACRQRGFHLPAQHLVALHHLSIPIDRPRHRLSSPTPNAYVQPTFGRQVAGVWGVHAWIRVPFPPWTDGSAHHCFRNKSRPSSKAGSNRSTLAVPNRRTRSRALRVSSSYA